MYVTGCGANLAGAAALAAAFAEKAKAAGITTIVFDRNGARYHGKVKAFAVTTLKRLSTPALKDLPTLNEAGLKGFEVSIWHGLYAPKGTPPDVLAKLSKALQAALKDPEFIKKEQGLGAVVMTDKRIEGAEHKKFVASEIAKWGPIIKEAGTYAD